jgi:FMN hydrolase / 5-amino-6-(5-phospho-D-ribitylamino)uracil phosphatase
VAIRVVLFDLMDTVLRDPYREALAAATSIPLEELFRRKAPELWPAFECGDLDEAAYWAHWAEDGIEVDREAFHRVRRAETRWVPGMRELLDDLAGVAVRVAASNYPVWVEELARDHLDGVFEHVVASCHLGVRKPDPAFFTGLLERVGARPQDACFVDDRPGNVAAAERLGIRGHVFVGAEELRHWLADKGVGINAGS